MTLRFGGRGGRKYARAGVVYGGPRPASDGITTRVYASVPITSEEQRDPYLGRAFTGGIAMAAAPGIARPKRRRRRRRRRGRGRGRAVIGRHLPGRPVPTHPREHTFCMMVVKHRPLVYPGNPSPLDRWRAGQRLSHWLTNVAYWNTYRPMGAPRRIDPSLPLHKRWIPVWSRILKCVQSQMAERRIPDKTL